MLRTRPSRGSLASLLSEVQQEQEETSLASSTEGGNESVSKFQRSEREQTAEETAYRA